MDMSYMYTIAKAINDLSDQNAAMSQSNNFIISNKNSETKSSKIIGAQVYGQYITISSSGTTNAANEKTGTVTFKPAFSSVPVVTATLVNTSSTTAATDTSLVLKDITTDSCTVVVKFGSSGLTSIGVNVMAIGFPTK